jgi:hypothetical protein
LNTDSQKFKRTSLDSHPPWFQKQSQRIGQRTYPDPSIFCQFFHKTCCRFFDKISKTQKLDGGCNLITPENFPTLVLIMGVVMYTKPMVLMIFIGISYTLWNGLSRSLFHLGITEPIPARCHFVLWFWIPPGPVPKRNQCFDSQY